MLRRMKATGPRPERWRDELLALVRAHALGENEALSATSGVTPVPGLEHVVAALADAQVASPDDRANLCSRIEAALVRHQQDMRRLVLVPAEQTLPRKELRRLGARYEEVRDREVRATSGTTALPRALDRPRADLYEMARRFGIEGRSSMTRTQLINALKSRPSS